MDEKLIIGENDNKKFVNLEGKTFGRLKVLYYAGKFGNGKRKRNYFYCSCECGKFKVFENGNLTTGHTQSCGCLQKENTSKAKLINIVGEKYGRLTVIERIGKEHQPKWLCKCECGNSKIISGIHLKNGHTKSCGCLSKEVSTSKIIKYSFLKGKDSPSYNPNITDEERIKGRFLFSKELSFWKIEVFKRDNFTCQCCFKRGNTLNAHHLNGYHWSKEERFDVKNGVTLCEKCHFDFHKMYGYKNNTKEQFIEYKNTFEGR